MFKEKYRSIIPNETNSLKNKEKNTYSESYDIAGFDNKVKFEIKLLRAEKSNYEVTGNYLYQIKNSSHFDIETELDFCNSLHFRTIDKNIQEQNKTIFHRHIEPYHELIRKKKKNKDSSKANLCKIQYNRGYSINTRIKLAFTFPSLKKQRGFVSDDHKEIQENFEIWRKYKPCLIEQLLLFYNDNSKKTNRMFQKKNTINTTFIRESDKIENKSEHINIKKINMPQKTFNYCNILETFARRNGLIDFNYNNYNNIYTQSDKDRQNLSSKSINEKSKKNTSNYKLASILNNEEISDGKNFYFVDETFPPCQIDYRIIDLSKEILINPKTEKDKDKDNNDNVKKKYIVYHYRPIESLNPGSKIIFNKEYVNPYDIKSGLVKNYNIISVFSHLSEYPHLLEKIFEENLVNDIGIYKVKLFYQGSWTPIYVDKFIPCFPLDFPIYTYSPISLWPCLLEKALAKIYRSYDNLCRISYFELYQLLTGFPIYNFKRIYRDREISNKLNLYEKFKLKDLGNITHNYRYMVNSNLVYNKGSEVVSKEDIINYYLKNNINDKGVYDYFNLNLNLLDQKNPWNNISEIDNKYVFNNNSVFGENNSYLLGFYASEAYLKYLADIHGFPIDKDKIKLLDKKLFAVKEANRKYVNIKSIYNYQLKQFLNGILDEEKTEEEDINSNEDKENENKENVNKETDSLSILWDIILTIFDNVIIIRANKYEEIHFRNAFIRCQDIEFPDHDRILAHTYYELKIRKGKGNNYKMKTGGEGANKDEKDKNDISYIKDTKKRDSKESLSPSRSSNIRSIQSKKKLKDFRRKKSSIKIKSMNSGIDSTKSISNQNNDIIPLTISLTLSNEHFLDSSFYSKELDMKLGIIQLSNNPIKEKTEEINNVTFSEKVIEKGEKGEKGGERSSNKSNLSSSQANIAKDVTNLNQIISDVFHGKNPILTISPDFQIGYSLVYDLYLEEGTYIIVPMTMGYCMQRNPKIISKNYVISDDKQNPLPLHKTVISKFLDDLFYINDPFCKNYIPYNLINDISKNIVDAKGKPVYEIDELSLINKYTRIGDLDLNTDKFGLSKLSFKDLIYELISPLNDNLKKKSMCNLGYEENTYPYLYRFIGVSFYFEKQKGNNKPDIITVTPKNNLIDANMDSIINIKILENCKHNPKVFGPTRVYYTHDNDSWYTIEGAYMKKFANEKKNSDNKKYYYVFNNEYYEKKKVFYSTFKSDLRVMMHPGNLLFIAYVVEDLLLDKNRQEFEEEEKFEDEKNYDEDESNDDLSSNSSYSKRSKNEETENDKSKSSEESKTDEKNKIMQITKMLFEGGN